MSYTTRIAMALGPSYTGLTLNAQLYDDTDTPVGSAVTTGFYERSGGKGLYVLKITIPDGHVGWLDIYVSGASSNVIASLPINPSELETKALMVEALATDTYAQLAGALSATPTLAEILTWLGMLARNVIIQTDILSTLRNAGDTADVATSDITINSTSVTRGEWT